ncbi:hypothetical protein RDI86_02190 [Cellulosimicrobium sp. XJ-DQ-B-000]|uniref:hypothetical protein n=1 Tax=Cellulosimicrobium sp. XJ-DQ-B-000 TaxID=3072182 RepID=UPI002806E241|nr:hypothetical protein [Cellulosimicrobium sp. XJ-DQ-B-000]MDQ8040651.1 hypothetical protein [Cellulosimicrobium sp. XJ-DQ-B-000]
MSGRSPFEAQRDATRQTIRFAQSASYPEFPRGTDPSAYVATRQVNATLAVAEAILTLAEAVRPAPVEVSVKVDIDEDQIVQSVRDAVGGGAA